MGEPWLPWWLFLSHIADLFAFRAITLFDLY